MRHNIVSIDNILLRWKSNESMKIECTIGRVHCTRLKMVNQCDMKKPKMPRTNWRRRNSRWHPICLGSRLWDIKIHLNKPRNARFVRSVNLHDNFATMFMAQYFVPRRVVYYEPWPYRFCKKNLGVTHGLGLNETSNANGSYELGGARGLLEIRDQRWY